MVNPLLRCLVLALVLVFWLPAQAALSSVDSTSDTTDASVGDGLCNNDGGNCTLSARVEEANANAIIADTSTPDCVGKGAVSAGHNPDDDGSCPFGAMSDQSNVADAMLDPLQNSPPLSVPALSSSARRGVALLILALGVGLSRRRVWSRSTREQ
jgi:hypothetical protein